MNIEDMFKHIKLVNNHVNMYCFYEYQERGTRFTELRFSLANQSKEHAFVEILLMLDALKTFSMIKKYTVTYDEIIIDDWYPLIILDCDGYLNSDKIDRILDYFNDVCSESNNYITRLCKLIETKPIYNGSNNDYDDNIFVVYFKYKKSKVKNLTTELSRINETIKDVLTNDSLINNSYYMISAPTGVIELVTIESIHSHIRESSHGNYLFDEY